MIIEPYAWHPTRITSLTPVAKDTVAIRLTRPDGYSFRAGQYTILRIHVGAEKFLVRQYSFSSPPLADWIELTVQREPGGEVTTWLHEHANVGDMIEISQSFGHFTFDDASRPLLFIAGRVGVAPFMSYLRQTETRDVHVLYSVHSRDELCYWEELAPLTTAVVTVEQPRIDQAMLARYVNNGPMVYICGSRQFAEAMQSHLHALGVGPDDIKRELFTL